jgi:acyl carrier protein
MQAVTLTHDLEKWLGRELDPFLLYDYPSVDTLARYLSENLAAASAATVRESQP